MTAIRVLNMREFTTIEKLASEMSTTYDSIVRYKSHVCFAKVNYKGEYSAGIYEFVDEPGAGGLSEIECRISLLSFGDLFRNSGEAIAWCFGYIDKLNR